MCHKEEEAQILYQLTIGGVALGAITSIVGSYFIFYVLTSWAYEFGPALLLTLTFLCLGFQWAQVRARLDRETVWFLGALGLYFVSQILILMIHG